MYSFPRHMLAPCFVIALCAGFVVALLPPPEGVDFAHGRDKIVHCVAFAGFAALGLTAWPARVGAIAITLVIYGFAIEIAQALVPWRSAELLDWLADSVGVFAVITARVLWLRLHTALRLESKP